MFYWAIRGDVYLSIHLLFPSFVGKNTDQDDKFRTARTEA